MSNYQNYDTMLQIAKQVGFIHCNTIIWVKGNKTSSNCSYMGAYEMIMQLRKGKSVPINRLGVSNLIEDIEPIKNTIDYITEDVIYDISNILHKTNHPTEKPIELFSRFILQSSKENEIVLDPFIGSGSCALSCIENNRKCIGIEIDEKYYKRMIERVKDV